MLSAARTLWRAGLLRPPRPDRALGMAAAYLLWGATPGGAYAVQAARDPHGVALVDPEGALTFAEVDRASDAVAAGLLADGVGPGTRVGVLCPNDRSFVLALSGAVKAGADAVLLNPDFAPPMLAAIAASEGLAMTLAPPDVAAYAATSGGGRALGRGTFTILTSGTTGTPKGTRRESTPMLASAAALLSAIPLRAGEATVVASPLFHAWGFAHLLLAAGLGSTAVLTGTFDAARTLAAVDEHEATALVAVPVMLRRLLQVEGSGASLRVVAVSGSALAPELAARFMDRYGDVLYDLYGSTETGWVSVAGPEDLRAAPGSVGRPPPGTTVEIHEGGRIHVTGPLATQAYTGDVGRIDGDGRLYVEGRADDMIVSGGENVFPGPVEEVLAALPEVADVAVVGVPDEEFGERLAAHVVLRPGAVLTEDEVRAAVRGALARHYVPRDVVFADAVLRTASGKVVRGALRRPR